MSDARAYASSLVEESLGLARGELERTPLPQDLVDQVSSVLRGDPATDVSTPFLEERMASLLPSIRESALKADGFFVRKARWPGAASFAVCLTHDVDNISRSAGHIWKTRSRFNIADLIGGLLGLVPLYNNVGLIASREAEHEFRSSFYFLSSNYPLATVRPESDRIRRNGWEVGLHGDFGTHDSKDKMEEALAKFEAGLGSRPTGVREHYLKFDYAKTWEVMEATGFDYDTTVGTNDKLGFKVGLATPFHPPDGSWNPLNVLEIPLVLMDTTLWGYLKRTEEQGFADAIRMTRAVEDVEGLMTLLWHQEAVRMRGGRVYWRLLREFASRGCFVGSGADVARWWRARAVPLLRDGKQIRLGGEPPKDLTIRVDLADDRAPRVEGGTIEGQGKSRLVRPSSREFSMEFS